MKTSTRTIVTMVVLIALIAGLYLFSDWFSKTTGYVLGEDEKVKLAQCLDGKNAFFYTEDNCLECLSQVERFGEDAFRSIKTVDCSSLEGLCNSLKKVPAWEIEGSFYYGDLELEELIEISRCDVGE